MALRHPIFLVFLLSLTLLIPSFASAASPLAVAITPNTNVTVNSTIRIQASGGTGPYWITISNPSMVLYTPSKLDRNGRPSGLWSMNVVKSGQCAFTIRDAAGATATATLNAGSQLAQPPPAAPLTATLSNPSPYINEATTLNITGGTAPYKVTSPSPGVTIAAVSPTQWKVQSSLPGNFTLNIADLNTVHTASVSATAKDRIPDLNAFFRDGKTTIYTQWPNRPQQQVISTETLSLQIVGGKGPWSVQTNPQWLNITGPFGNVATAPYYQIVWTGTHFSSADIVVRDSRGYVKTYKVTSPAPLLLDVWPKNRMIKANETFLIIVRGGVGPFMIDWDQNTALTPWLKDMQHSDPGVLHTWGISGLKPGSYRFQVSDATSKITRFVAVIGLTVTP